MMNYKISELRNIIKDILLSQGYNNDDAEISTEVLLYAELRGNNQGLVKLGSSALLPDPCATDISIVRESKVTAQLDGGRRIGMAVVNRGVQIAIQKAKEHGVAVVGCSNYCSATGALGIWATKITEAGLVGIVMSQCSEMVAPHGSYEPIFGTNPFAIGVPTVPRPQILDMATSAEAWFGLVTAELEGKSIRPDVAYDSEGRETTSPAAALAGALRVFDRSYKGSHIALMVELLAGAMTGAAMSDKKESKNWGSLIIAIDPAELCGSLEEFQHNAGIMCNRVKNAKKLEGVSEIMLPGERGDEVEAQNIERGTIQISQAVHDKLQMIQNIMNSSLILDKLDDLPSLMHVVQTAPASTRRFRTLVNNSLSMEETLQDNTHRDHRKPTSYSKYGTNIIRQASNLLVKEKPPINKSKPKRDIGEIAKIAKEALISTSNSGDPRNLFRNFDECRNGYVTYEDFNQTLLSTNAGLTKKEIFLLARTLDRDQNGILDYTELTSSLANVCNKYSNSKLVKSIETNEQGQEAELSPKSTLSFPSPAPASSPPPVDPVAEGYQRAYEYGLKYLQKTQESHEEYVKNERKYYQSLGPDIEIPYSQRIFHLSALQPPRSTDFQQKSYHRGSGNIPTTMVDHLNGVLSSSSYQEKSHRIGSEVDEENESTSYSDIYLRNLQNRPENELTGITKSYNGRHITGAGALSTTAVMTSKGAACGGPVGAHERAFYGNPTNPTNRSSRDFTNAFIIDQAKPIRRKKRSSSAPPSRSLDNKSLHNCLQKQISPENQENERNLPLLPAEQENEIEKNSRAFMNLPYEQTKSDGIQTILFSTIPPNQSYLDTHKDRKKRVHPVSTSSSSTSSLSNLDPTTSSSNIHMSLNTLLSQMNSYSKMKIFEHKMKQYDISHSGYINKSEFISSLTRSGVHLTPEQAHIIFETHAQEPKYQIHNSVKLSDHDTRGIPIAEFINKLQTRISTPALQKKFIKESNAIASSSSSPSSSSSHDKTTSKKKEKDLPLTTPQQQRDQLTWKKLITTLNSKQLDTKRSLEFFKNIQIHYNNQIPVNQFLTELHSFGIPLDEIEYHNLITNIQRTSDGKYLDLNDFSKQLYIKNQQILKEEEKIALMPSLEHPPTATTTAATATGAGAGGGGTTDVGTSRDSYSSNKRYIQQKKHFIDQQGKETFFDNKAHNNTHQYLELLHSSSSSPSTPTIPSVPTCLLNGNTIDTKKERLRWYKMKENILQKRNDLLHIFGGMDHLQEEYSPTQIRDKLTQAGLQLGDEDYKLFHSFVQNTTKSSTNQTTSRANNLNFEQICDSFGITVQTDSSRRPRAICSEDCQRDGGIFGASEKSLLSHPTYRVNMLSSSLDDTALGRGNRRRHYNPITGELLNPSATSQLKISTSEFWEMKHIPEIKGIPGNLPRKGHEDSSSTGHKYQGTSLRDLQNHRNNKNKRSSSAPPPTTTSRNQHQQTMITTTPDTSSSLSKQYLWQNRGHGGGDKKPFSTRFAATPLAQYLKLRHGQEPSSPYIPVNDTQNMTPMRTSELNSSIASSISFHKDDPYVMSSKGGYLRTELHDLNGNEASEMESRVR